MKSHPISLISSALSITGFATIALTFVAPLFKNKSYVFDINQLFFQLVGSGLLLSGLALRFSKERRSLYGPVLSLAMLLVVLLLIETVSHVIEVRRMSSIPDPTELQLPSGVLADAELGLRMQPFFADHDAWGFRNNRLLERADIVAIGDSQTWGVNVDGENAWPQVLAQVSAKTVYNMSLGSFGPVQYGILSQKALRLSPKIILIGLYLGNDLYDAYRMAYGYERHTSLRDNTKADLLPDTITARAEFLRSHPKNFLLRNRTGLNHLASLRIFLKQGTQPDRFQTQREWARKYPGLGAFYDNGKIRTVFTPAYRLLALDLNEPRIREGLRITKKCLLQAHFSANQQSIHLMVVLLPTKEAVFASVMSPLQSQNFKKVANAEAESRRMILEFCRTHAIETTDMLPVLSRAVLRNQQIYPENSDGHPGRKGYRLISLEILKTLRKLQWI